MDTGAREDGPTARDAALFRAERERAERARRRDRLFRTIVAWVMAAALGLLAYDSAGAALDARRAGRPWLYPACVSACCVLALLVLAVLAVRGVRRRRARISYRGPS